jgi:hypothetical protein
LPPSRADGGSHRGPHRRPASPMPQIELMREEIGDLAAYIISLRNDQTP